MLEWFRNLLQPPTFDDPESNIQAQNINTILLITLILTFLYFFYSLLFPNSLSFPGVGQVVMALSALAIELGLFLLIRKRKLKLASIIFTSLVWAAILVEGILYGGVRVSGLASFAAVIVVASLITDTRAGVFFTLLTILAGGGLLIAENQHWIPISTQIPNNSILISHNIIFIAVLLWLYLIIQSSATAAKKAQGNERVMRDASLRLEEDQTSLEVRTVELEKQNIVYQTFVDISRLAGQIRKEDELLDRAAQLIAAGFHLEHVNIFLLDEEEEYAILQASNSEAGKSMIREQYRLALRKWASPGFQEDETLGVRIGNNSYNIPRPATLYEMHTNISFPVAEGNQLFGLLNLQSTSTVIEAEEQSILQTIADQIANSLGNMRQLAKLQRQLQEVGRTTGQTVQETWEKVAAGTTLAYQYDRIRVLPADEQFPMEVTRQLLEGKSVVYNPDGRKNITRLVAPIMVRDQIIGTIGYEENNPGRSWERDNIILLETIASQVGLTLENTRLIAEAQQRARHEQLTSEVTSHIRETLDLETVLQTAAQQIQRALDLKEAEVRLGLPGKVTGAEYDQTTRINQGN